MLRLPAMFFAQFSSVLRPTYHNLRYDDVPSGIRLGLYGPIKELLAGQECRKLNLWDKIVAGSLSGGIAAVVTSPLELIKVCGDQ